MDSRPPLQCAASGARPPPGVPQQGAWQVTGFAGGIGWGELVVGTVTSLSVPHHTNSLPFSFSRENQFSEISKGANQDLIISCPQAPGHLPHAQLPGSKANQLEALPTGPAGRGGTAKGPQNGPFPRSGAQFPRL